MWVSLLFLAVWFHKPFVYTDTLSVPYTDTEDNTEDVLCRSNAVIFPPTGTPYYAQLQSTSVNGEILWKKLNANKFAGAVIKAVLDMPHVVDKLNEIILGLLSGNHTTISESPTKPQESNEAEIYAKLMRNISSEFVQKEDYLVKVQEQESRIKMARNEAIQTTSRAFDNLDKAVLALEKKINAIDSSEAEIYTQLLENVSSEFFRKEDYLVEVQEQETRIKMARDEAIQTTLQAFKDNLDKTILALEGKINAIESQAKSEIKTNILDTRSQDLFPAEYYSKGIEVYHEFKENRSTDLPLTSGYPLNFPDSYTVLNTTGGYVMQTTYTGNAIHVRSENVSNHRKWTSTWEKTSKLN